jgi:hypothetical protein
MVARVTKVMFSLEMLARRTRERKKENQVTQGRVKEERRISKFQLRINRADNHEVKNPGRRRQKD